MLKADEFQGRVGTPSAFVSSGGSGKPNSDVLSPRAKPKLNFVAPNPQASSSNQNKFVMKSSELAALVKGTMSDVDSDCPKPGR